MNWSTSRTASTAIVISQVDFKDATQFKNHGDYVSSMGGGADAAHSCIGMPISK